ncbi:TPA: ead/Ea22-like family protein [Klebsiella oxytoca]|nr:ead/Ea22-like family protein [Klebsiella oxytoca]
MNISTVNELIQSLESAGELSIKERKYLELAKAYQELAAENVGLKAAFDKPQAYLSWHAIPPTWDEPLPCGEYLDVHDTDGHKNSDGTDCWPVYAKPEIETPTTDRIVAGIKADGRIEGAHFVANRMLAAWDAGFIDDTAKNAADIARMILTSTEFMADAPEGDFDRSFADGILEDIAQQLREGAK